MRIGRIECIRLIWCNSCKPDICDIMLISVVDLLGEIRFKNNFPSLKVLESPEQLIKIKNV